MITRDFFQNIPSEVLKQIIKYLPIKHLALLSHASKFLHLTINNFKNNNPIKLTRNNDFQGTYGELSLLLNKNHENSKIKEPIKKVISITKKGNDCIAWIGVASCAPVCGVTTGFSSIAIGNYSFLVGPAAGIASACLFSYLGDYCSKAIKRNEDEFNDSYPELVQNPQQLKSINFS